jgi:hypothetical protein
MERLDPLSRHADQVFRQTLVSGMIFASRSGTGPKSQPLPLRGDDVVRTPR